MIVLNYILAGFIWLDSLLPFFILYGISDILFLVAYYIIGYRKKVVYINLRNSFPDKQEKEIKKIARKFYHNLCDVFVESAKETTISSRKLLKMFHFKNIEIIDKLYNEGRSVIGVTAHIGNWEWLVLSLKFTMRHKYFFVVQPLKSKFWDKKISKLRSRFGNAELIPFTQTMRVLAKNRNHISFTLLGSDQSPSKDSIKYRTIFLNQDTPMFLGVEKIAKSLDLAIVFINNQRVKRGYYEVTFSLLSDDPKNTAENEITEMHLRALEKVIIKTPKTGFGATNVGNIKENVEFKMQNA